MKILLTLVVFAAAAAPAFARDSKSGSWQVGNDSIHVHYADLDVTKAAGRALLLARVQKAAARLCIDDVDRANCIVDMVDNSANPAVRQALADRIVVTMARR